MNKCDLCEELLRGMTLYKPNSWDGGIGFDYIYDVQYCPLCGEKLLTFKERQNIRRLEESVLYHLSCSKCGYDWWSSNDNPNECLSCKSKL